MVPLEIDQFSHIKLERLRTIIHFEEIQFPEFQSPDIESIYSSVLSLTHSDLWQGIQ